MREAMNEPCRLKAMQLGYHIIFVDVTESPAAKREPQSWWSRLFGGARH